jgi:6-phosphogluconolactonase/glucosamine-6-phosphate isomerase/deaminase
MIRGAILDRVPIPAEQAHPMEVLLDDPATAYEGELRKYFSGSGVPRLDFVVLGMGDDAHTASLFPGSPGIGVVDRWVLNHDGPRVTPPPRVTMTFLLLNHARELAVLVVGRKKYEPLRKVDEQLRGGGPDADKMPITGIQPWRGRVTWYLDSEAAGG